MTSPQHGWLVRALLSAAFSALAAVFAKVALAGIDLDYATLVRTLVVLLTLGALVIGMGKWRSPFDLPGRTATFLMLSGLATGASWVCYFRARHAGEASKLAPVDELSVMLVALLAAAFLSGLPTAREWLGIAMISAGVLTRSLRR